MVDSVDSEFPHTAHKVVRADLSGAGLNDFYVFESSEEHGVTI